MIYYFVRVIGALLMISAIVAVLVLSACAGQPLPQRETGASVGGSELAEFEYQGCEYIRWYHGITHKGNCRNPVHQQKPCPTVLVNPPAEAR